MLGEKIKEIRKKFGFTQEELAEKLNVSRQAVAKWETENGVPDTENLKALSKLFGTSIDTLLDNKVDIPLMFLHQEINLKDYGKTRAEQYLNLLNKNFDESWKIYSLSWDKKTGIVDEVVGVVTNYLSELPEVFSMLKDGQNYFLAVKDNYKLLVDIKNNSLDIKSLNSNINIKKFEFEKKKFFIITEIQR